MGMGDKKVKYTPPTYLVECDVTKKKWNRSIVRSCPEPNVKKKFYHKIYNDKNQLEGVETTVCIYVCKKCKYGRFADGGSYCDYGKV